MEDFYMCECNRCGAKMSNHEFNSGHEPLSDLPFNILRKLAQGKITEEQAWEEAANA